MTIDLKSPALLIIDMQNGFCHSQGTFGKLNLLSPTNHHISIVPTITAIRSAAQTAKIPIIFTRLSLSPDYSDAGVQFEPLPHMKALSAFVNDTWDAQVVDELRPDSSKGEIEITKTRSNAFWSTGLEEVLRARRVDQLIVTGVGTNVCVESTVRDAITRDFYVKTVSDATACLSPEEHEASLRSLNWYGGVATAEEVISAFQNFRKGD